MSVSDALTSLGDVVRNLTYKSDKMSIAEMASALNVWKSLPNIILPMPILKDAKGLESVADVDGSQTLSNPGNAFTGEDLTIVNNMRLPLKKGDTLAQSVLIKSSEEVDLTANFFGEKGGNHLIFKTVNALSDSVRLYKYTYTVQEDDTYDLLKFWIAYHGTDSLTFFNPYAAIIN